MNPTFGVGEMKMVALPKGLEFYHFSPTKYTIPVEMTSIIPADESWYLIHINIGKDKQHKKAGDKVIEFHRYLPSGILVYCPGIEISTNFPVAHEAELVSFRLPKSFIEYYFKESIIDTNHLILYKDLDTETETKIRQALDEMHNKLRCHAIVLDVLNTIFQKIKEQKTPSNGKKLHGNDINNLFYAAAYLRNPLADNVPSITELAAIAKMSITKFKISFKQLFGSAPMQYHLQIKMDYAQKELQMNKKSPVELSHELGYSHPSNFTSAYKKHFGKLPSDEFGH